MIKICGLNKAFGGCSDILKEVFENFGYRMNALSAECFFASGVFSGDRQCSEKFDPYRCEDNGFVCSAWISVFQVWTAVFLADLSSDGSAHNTGRI